MNDMQQIATLLFKCVTNNKKTIGASHKHFEKLSLCLFVILKQKFAKFILLLE